MALSRGASYQQGSSRGVFGTVGIGVATGLVAAAGLLLGRKAVATARIGQGHPLKHRVLDVAAGALVNPGAPIVTLDDLSTMRVDFQVPERFLAQIHEGQPLSASVDAYPGETVNGHIAKLDTRVDERTRAITARAEFPNSKGRLKPGMMVRIGVSRGQRQALSAPESGVSVEGDNAFVFVIQKNGARTFTEQRPVVTGVRREGFVEITDGVRPGEQIVADGLNKIQGGQTIRIGGRPAGGPGDARARAGKTGAAAPTGARPAA